MEFDGTSWRSHALPNYFARSISPKDEGGICVGGVGDIGCLEPSSTGELEYRDLVQLLPEEERDFADVWTTLTVDGVVYFQSFKAIFRWDGNSIRIWHANGRFHKAFVAGGRYFVREEGLGLLTQENDSLVLVQGGEKFAYERIDALLPLGERILIVARERGMLLWDGVTYQSFPTEPDSYLDGKRIYHGKTLSDSTFALATFSGSVLILDRQGNLISRLAENVGLLPDEMVLDVFQDRQGGLWLALDSGILRVDAPTPLTRFDSSLGIEGIVYDAYRFNGVLFVGTSQGLFYLDRPAARAPIEQRQAYFQRVVGINEQVFHIITVADRLLVATNDGVYEVAGSRASPILEASTRFLRVSRRDPHRVYVGLSSGVSIIQREARGWESSLLASGDEVGEVRVIRELDDGSLLLSTATYGLVRLIITDGVVTQILRHHEDTVLTTSMESVVRLDVGELAVVARDGVYRILDQEQLVLRRDTVFDRIIDFSDQAGYLLSVAPNGELWIINRGKVGRYRQEGGQLVDITPPLLQVSGLPLRQLMIEEDGVVWIGAQEGLLRYDPRVEKDYGKAYPALIRSVTDRQQRRIYGGAGMLYIAPPEVFYADNSLRFEVAAPSFNSSRGNEFQFWLEGFEDGWSPWSRESFKEYSNLREGRYRFHVRARNAQGVVSETDTFAFTVMPPWYRSWWAYLAYLLSAGFVIWGYGHWRLREHRKEMERERQVREELEMANVRLKQANERLHEADKLKDDVLANVSHELRTPLTSILGFAAVLSEGLRGENREFAEHIHKSGKRLQRTVDTLLDMARLQADTMEIELQDIDLAAAVREIVRGLEPAASAKDLYLGVLPDDFVLPVRTDPAAIDRILTNLVGNAIKFTEEGGVTVLVDGEDEHVYLTVSDTGIGIRKEFLPHLFGEFKQASAGYGRSHEGTGLGLAVTHRLVQLLEGEIRAESRLGGGTSFVVRLPRYLQRCSEGDGAPLSSVRLRDRRLLLIIDPTRHEYALRSALDSLADVDVAAGLEAGRERLRSRRYDVVLIDGHLDPLHSEGTLASLRVESGAEAAAFVAVTAATMPGDRDRFRALGFDEHVGKPFTRSRLLTSIESLLDRPRVA